MARIVFDAAIIAKCHKPEDITWKDVTVIHRRPPNFDAIAKVFPGALKPGVCFAYDGTIFNPWGIDLGREIFAHEVTHFLQQKEMGGAEAWWAEYLKSLEFRFAMEVDAYRIEYRYLAREGNRHERRRAFKVVAGKLSGPLYNNMVTIRTAEQFIEAGGWDARDTGGVA